MVFFFFSSRRRHTRWTGDWSSDVCSSDLLQWARAASSRCSRSSESCWPGWPTPGGKARSDGVTGLLLRAGATRSHVLIAAAQRHGCAAGGRGGGAPPRLVALTPADTDVLLVAG